MFVVVKRRGHLWPIDASTPPSTLNGRFRSLDFQHVDPVIISQKVIQGVYPGVTTSELDE
jgi:hypothetical protein